jgi:two-component system, cell cycle sensor histidine kinase and response regulator CckA
VMNLAVNARDAMPAGGSLVIETRNVELDSAHIAVHPEAPSRHCVLMSVSDTGCGMDADVLRRAFEPFFTTKKTGEGTGMGLATVFGIVCQSEGQITVKSEPGIGSTFCVYLPRINEPILSEESAVLSADCPCGSETILLVEDEESVLWLARRILKNAGYTVLEACDGEAAHLIASATSGPIDLLVTDLIMPGMSGLEAAVRLSAMRPEIKVLYVSGYTDDAAMHRGAMTHGAAFLQKPYTRNSLTRKVRQVLDSQ